MLRHVSSRISTQPGGTVARGVLLTQPCRAYSTDRVAHPKRPSPPPFHASRSFRKADEGRPPQGRPPPPTSKKFTPRFTPRSQDPTEPDRLLRPPVLSERIKKLCAQGQLEDAVTMLKNAPLDAQNTVVWNTMMSEVCKARRYKLAYNLYIDMKRRGFKPNLGTFQTLMGGYMKIEDWYTYSKQLENVHSLMDNFYEYVDAAKEDPVLRESLHTGPIHLYIHILGDARDYQKMFDVYNSMDSTGPLAPDNWIYGAMMHALSERRVIKGMPIDAVFAQNASDARLIWRQYLKSADYAKGCSEHVVTALLRCLMRGRPSDILFALEIVRDYCGLTKPGEEHVPAKVGLMPPLMSTIMDICINNNKHRLAIQYVQQVMDRPLKDGETYPLDRPIMEQVLKAYNYLSSLGSMGEGDQSLETLQWMLRQEIENPDIAVKMRPRLETYALVLVTCWRCADWASATRTFELLTGCHAEFFADGHLGKLRIDKRSPGRNIVPDEQALSALIRTAVATGDVANIRQSIRMAEHYDLKAMLDGVVATLLKKDVWTPKPRTNEDGAELVKVGECVRGLKLQKERKFYGAKLAEVVYEAIENIWSKDDKRARKQEGMGEDKPTPEEGDKPAPYVIGKAERRQWESLHAKAGNIIRETRRLRVPHEPKHESQPLGSARGIASTDLVVDYEMTQRQTHSV